MKAKTERLIARKPAGWIAIMISQGHFTAPRGKKAHPRRFVPLDSAGALAFLFSRWRG